MNITLMTNHLSDIKSVLNTGINPLKPICLTFGHELFLHLSKDEALVLQYELDNVLNELVMEEQVEKAVEITKFKDLMCQDTPPETWVGLEGWK